MPQFEYQISEGDYVSAAKLAMRKSGWKALLFVYVFPALGAILVLCWMVQAIAERRLPPSIAPLLWGALALCMPLLLNFSHRKEYRKAAALHGRRTLEIDDSDLHFRSAGSNSRTNWHAYRAFSEDRKSFVLLELRSLEFVSIPKRELDPAQIDELRALLAEHLPRK